MALIRDRKLVTEDESWLHLDDEAAVPPAGDVTLSVARLLREPGVLEREARAGVRLGPDDDPAALKDLLPRLDLVTVDFPKFTDGRGYSIARLLRDRLGYTKELRAVGHVLTDQLFYMARVGFNAFELVEGKSVEHALAALDSFSVTYQAAADDGRPLFRRVAR